MQQPGKKKLLILKTKKHSFHTKDISYMHFYLKKIAQVFYSEANKSLKLISRNIRISLYLSFFYCEIPYSKT